MEEFCAELEEFCADLEIDTGAAVHEFEGASEKPIGPERVEISTGVQELDPKLWSLLPEENLEMIIGRLPLKALVQSQVLSRKWRSLYSSRAFQNEVSSVSSRWASYYPLYVTRTELTGYDRTCNKWQNLFELPEFPEVFFRAQLDPLAWTVSLCSVAGSLIVLSDCYNQSLSIFVCNPVNKSSRMLPNLDMTNSGSLDPTFEDWEPYDGNVLVLPVSHHSYKVLVFSRSKVASVLQVQVYDSEAKSWAEPQRGPVLPRDFRRLDAGGHLGKTVYLALRRTMDDYPCTLRSCLQSLLFYAYDVEVGEFTEIPLSSPQELPNIPVGVCKLGVCCSDLVLLVGQGSFEQDESQRWRDVAAGIRVNERRNAAAFLNWGKDLYTPKDSFVIYKLDLSAGQLKEISRGPSEKMAGRTTADLVVLDKDCIYIETESFWRAKDRGALMFDMLRQVWRPLPLDEAHGSLPLNDPFANHDTVTSTDYSFRPGLNPFVCA